MKGRSSGTRVSTTGRPRRDPTAREREAAEEQAPAHGKAISSARDGLRATGRGSRPRARRSPAREELTAAEEEWLALEVRREEIEGLGSSD